VSKSGFKVVLLMLSGFFKKYTLETVRKLDAVRKSLNNSDNRDICLRAPPICQNGGQILYSEKSLKNKRL
jgi:hypothetical protein